MNAMTPITPISDVFIKAMVARIVSIDKRSEVAATARALFPNTKHITEAAISPADFIRRSLTNPAMVGTAGWASELAGGIVNVDILSTLAPRSAYASLAAIGLRVDTSGAGLANLPGWSTVPTGGAFVGEGQPISVRQASFSKAVLEPHKAAIIALFSAEIANRSTPSIQAILSAGLETIIQAEIDSVLLGTGASSASSPAGLFNNAIAVTPAAGGGLAALCADLGALVSAVSTSGPVQKPVFVMNSADAVRALTWAQGLNSDQITILVSPYQLAKKVGFLDASSFASAAGDDIEVVISKDATVVSRTDAVPIRDAARRCRRAYHFGLAAGLLRRPGA